MDVVVYFPVPRKDTISFHPVAKNTTIITLNSDSIKQNETFGLVLIDQRETLSPGIRLKAVRGKPLGALPHTGTLPGLQAVTFGLAIHTYSKQPLLPKRNKELGC